MVLFSISILGQKKKKYSVLPLMLEVLGSEQMLVTGSVAHRTRLWVETELFRS